MRLLRRRFLQLTTAAATAPALPRVAAANDMEGEPATAGRGGVSRPPRDRFQIARSGLRL